MPTTVLMPQMGYDMKEGTVVRWRKHEGEAVSRGEVIAEIETDKATVEMEAYSTGVLAKIVVEEGRMVPVGELIALITEPGEPLPSLEEFATKPAPAEQVPETASEAPPKQAPSPAAASSEVRATPIARRLACEKGVDLSQLSGSGPGGRVTEADVMAYEGKAKEAPAPEMSVAGGQVELSRMRRAIARVTTQSKSEVPHFYVTSEIDMSEAMSFRKQLNQALQDGTRVSVNDMLVKAVARALAKFPKFNASFKDDHLELHTDLNIGIAIALEQGLIIPSILSCQSKSLVEIAMATTALIQRAQEGRLSAEEYSGGTFAISNLGMYDVDNFTAIIFPPNAGVLAVGSVVERPVVRSGQITVARTMKATLSVDHRVADGAEGAQFLMEVKRSLENPVSMLL